MIRRVAAVTLTLMVGLVPGCKKRRSSTSKARTATPCTRPGTVLLDGKPVEFTGALAVKDTNPEGYRILLYRNAKVDCSLLTSGQAIQLDPKMGLTARIAYSKSRMSAVGFDVHTQIGAPVKLLSAPEDPTKAQGSLSLCVEHPFKFKPVVGRYKGRQVTMKGRFSAKYCGIAK